MSSPPGTRPTAGQSLVIMLAAVALTVTACFGALGFGMASTSGSVVQPLGILLALASAIAGLVGFCIGFFRLIGAFTSRADAPPVPITGPQPSATPAGWRPTFGQGFLILIAGLVLFSGACASVADSWQRFSSLEGVLAVVAAIAGTVAAIGGFVSMVRLRPRAPDATVSIPTPPGDVPAPPSSPEEPRS
jgi:hypothetical protein